MEHWLSNFGVVKGRLSSDRRGEEYLFQHVGVFRRRLGRPPWGYFSANLEELICFGVVHKRPIIPKVGRSNPHMARAHRRGPPNPLAEKQSRARSGPEVLCAPGVERASTRGGQQKRGRQVGAALDDPC